MELRVPLPVVMISKSKVFNNTKYKKKIKKKTKKIPIEIKIINNN